MRHRSREDRRGLQAEAAAVRHPSSEEEGGMSAGRLSGRRKPASRTPAEPVPGLSGGSLPPEPAAAPRGRARKLLSPSSGLTGGHGAAPAGSRRAASAWRRLALLPVLALVLGALCLLDAAPVGATHETAPTGVSVSASQSGQLAVTWTKPASTLGSRVRWRVKSPQGSWQGGGEGERVFNQSCAATTCSFTITGLTNGTTYEVQVGIRNFHDHWSASADGTPQGAALSTNANLSGLTAKSAASATGTFSALALTPATFSAATTAYTASVANGVTHVKLTPTKAHTGASIKVGKGTSLSAVTSGSESSAIALSVGSNAIKVEVTAQDGTTKRTYTVTVTRAAATLSTNANLSGLTAAGATSATGAYSSLSLTPAFSATRTSATYEVSVPVNITHVKLTPTKAHTGASIKVGKFATVLSPVNSGSESSAIALSAGSTLLVVEVTAQDGTTKKTYNLTMRWDASTPSPLWSATLTAKATTGTGRGCDNSVTGSKCSSTSVLTDDDFTHASHTYEISAVEGVDGGDRLTVEFNRDATVTLDGYKLCVGATALAFSSATHTAGNRFAAWTPSPALPIRTGDTVSLSIVPSGSSCPTAAPTARTPTAAGPSAGLALSVAPGDGSLALTWNKPWGPNYIYEVQWKASSAPDADASTPGDPSTGWVAPGRARIVNGVPQTRYTSRTEYTIRGLANGTAYDVRVRPYAYPGEAEWPWSAGTGTPAAPAPPASLTLSVDAEAIEHEGSVTVTARLDAPAMKAMEVWFDTAGDGGAARWGPDCAWEHGASDMFAAGQREATVKLCATAAGAGRTMTVTAGTHDPALTAAAVRVRVQGPNPPTALSVHADPQAVAAGGTVTVTVRLDRPSAPGMTVHLHLNGVGAASWGACGGTAAARTLPSPLSGYRRVEIPPGGREAAAELCVLWEAGPRLELGAYSYAPRLDAPDLALPGPGGLGLRALTVTSPDPSQRVAQGEVALEAQSSSYEVRVPLAVDRVTVKPAAKYASAAVKVNGQAVDAGAPAVDVPLEEGENPVVIEVSVPKVPAVRKYTLTVVRGGEAEGGERQGDLLTASFEAAPETHDGGTFTFLVRLSEVLGTSYSRTLRAAAFAVAHGRVESVEQVEAGLWRVRVAPSSAAKAVTVTLAGGRGCDADGAVCTPDGRALSNTSVAAVAAAPACEAGAGPLCGLALTAGSGAVALSPAFAPGVTFYRASVPAGTAGVTLAPHWGGEASVFAGSRWGATTFTRPARVRPSGTAVALALAPDGGATELWVMASGPGGRKTYRIDVTEAQARAEPLTAAFEAVPPEHDGREAFWLKVRFSEALGAGGGVPSPASFRVRAGKARKVERVEAGLWRVKVRPDAWRDVTVTLADGRGCAEEGAVCASGGRALANAPVATVGGPVRIRIEGGKAREGKDASLDFAVTLNRAAAHEVSVDYATADGAAKAGADYTAASGTLVFAPGETAKTVSVAILDDAVDEGKETFVLRLSNPRGAYLRGIHREAKGVIRNEDPMPGVWLARFGRTAAENVVEAVGARIEGDAGAARMVLGGQELGLDGSAGREALLARLAERYRREAGARRERGEDAPPPVREVSMSELLLASSFHMASAGDAGASPGRWSVWGRGARSSFSGKEGVLTLEGDVTTAALGADYERARWLVGVALARSSGDGSYRADGAGGAGEVESALTGVYPYARYRVSGSFSLWGVVGLGSGGMTLTPGGAPPVDADVDMGMAAGGARGVLLPARAPGGFELALRADVLVTDTRSDAAADLAETEAGTSRVRLLLEGSRSLRFGDAVLTPSVEIGFRNDSGDAETGGGVEAGGGLRWSSGALTAEVRARGLISHNEGGYEEWGVSASVGYAPGPDGRGLSLRAGSSWGAAAGGAERLWSQAAGLSPGGAFEPGAAGFDAEAGWGLDAWGGLLTPYTGFTLTGSGETYRAGGRFRLAESLTMSLEGDLRERDGGASVHGVALKGSMRW